MKDLKYGLSDQVPIKENLIYACQHVIFFLASAVVMPVFVGYALGLEQLAVAATLQRTLVLCGVVSILQVTVGHRYPIMDGPAGLWSGLMILIAGTAVSFGKDLMILRAELQLGIIIGGAAVLLLAVLGILGKLLRLFTPLVNGVLIMLMVLQISPSIVKGMTGISSSQSIDGRSTAIFSLTMLLILFINRYGKGFIQSIAAFIGVITGWIAAWFTGLTEQVDLLANGIFTIPMPMAWGALTFDAGITITCLVATLVLLSMVFASVNGMAEALGDSISERRMEKAMLVHGAAGILAGFFPTVPFMPYVSSTGVVRMTGVAARSPFILASAVMILMGLIAPVGTFFSTMPAPVGYAALIMVFALILGQGLKELQKVPMENREHFIIGISMLIGMGVMFLPAEAFSQMPETAGSLLSNGLIDGMAAAILLEHIVLRKNKEKKND